MSVSPINRNVEPPRFRSVADTAAILGMSEVNIYRAIHAGEFPAVKVRGRIVIPARAIDAMESDAMTNGLVDAATYVAPTRVA
jgi:predicted DNA-binding transcriptional regulator AlpA